VLDSPPPDLPLDGDEFLRSVPYVDGRKRLGSVALHARLGKGAMGAVYRGTHLILERDVAVKCLIMPSEVHDADATRMIRLFRREARIGADLTHENLVRLFELGEAYGVHYLVLEFVDGEDAKSYVTRRGPLGEIEAARIVLKVARGLAKAHQHPDVIVHRDIKPANIMISRRGDVKLGDLGLAKAVEQMSAASMLSGLGGVGTSAFMPPEQRRLTASLTPAADIWALGVTLYYFLTQRVPGVGSDEYEWLRLLEAQGFPDVRELRPDVSPELARILRRCTRFDPRERIQDASALARELQAFLHQQAPAAPARAKLKGDAQRPAARPPIELVQPVETTVLPLDGTNVGDESRERSATVASVPKPRRARAAPWVWIGVAGLVLAAGWAGKSVWRPASPAVGRAPEGWEVVDGTPGASGWARRVKQPESGIEFSLVEPDKFEMGSPRGETGRIEHWEKRHLVRITKPYYLARTETTRAQYYFPVPSGSDLADANLPVTDVSWDDAVVFCQKIGCALPTEAQWEFAARAGATEPYVWGTDPKGGVKFANVLDETGQRELAHVLGKQGLDKDPFPFDDKLGPVASVGLFEHNDWGFYDMHGNVAEWCADGFIEDHSSLGVDDPYQRGDTGLRSIRGGSYVNGVVWNRLAHRRNSEAGMSNVSVGFRVVRNLP